jgi:hypothetical protein
MFPGCVSCYNVGIDLRLNKVMGKTTLFHRKKDSSIEQKHCVFHICQHMVTTHL